MNLAVIPRPSRALALKGRMPLGGPMQFAVLGLHPGLAGQAGLIERALAGKNRRVQPVSARLEMDPALPSAWDRKATASSSGPKACISAPRASPASATA